MEMRFLGESGGLNEVEPAGEEVVGGDEAANGVVASDLGGLELMPPVRALVSCFVNPAQSAGGPLFQGLGCRKRP